MTEVRIAAFKANLSAHLSSVRKGNVLVVYDRATPIARVVPFKAMEDDDLTIDRALDPPAAARRIKPLNLLKNVDVDRVLAEMRADRS